MTYCYYVEADPDQPAAISVERQTEYLVCTDPTEPGGTEVWSTYRSTVLQDGFATVHAATDAALQAAQAHLVCEESWSGRPPGRQREKGVAVMWTAIWTVLGFVLLLCLLLFLGEPILALVAEQLRERRTHRLQLERERTKQAMLALQRDATVWQQLTHVNSSYQSSDFKS